MKKTAFITGISGQDGSYLAELLLEKGYEVHGLVRRSSSFETWWRLDGIRGKVDLHYGDITDPYSLLWALRESRPDEVYHLAAQSHVQVSWETPYYTAQATGIGTLNLLEAVRFVCPKARIYNASTSELFSGAIGEAPQNESTPKDPVSPYGTAKLYGFQIAKNYREAYKMFICNGILFNHESPRRGDNFVTKKVVNAVKDGVVRLGNLEASRDWGYAPEYVEAMWLMLQQKEPDDYVVATGTTHTVKEWTEWVQEVAQTPLRIIQDFRYDRPTDVALLKGDSTKAEKRLGWKAKVQGKGLVKAML